MKKLIKHLIRLFEDVVWEIEYKFIQFRGFTHSIKLVFRNMFKFRSIDVYDYTYIYIAMNIVIKDMIKEFKYVTGDDNRGAYVGIEKDIDNMIEVVNILDRLIEDNYYACGVSLVDSVERRRKDREMLFNKLNKDIETWWV